MFLNDRKEQKSPKRRFLLIIGVTAFIGFCVMGFGLIFWDKFPGEFPQSQRTIFGIVILIYAVIRFSRYLRKDPEEVDEN